MECLDGDNTSSDWPNGSEHREYMLGTEPHKWKETKWAWHSQGHVNCNGQQTAEVLTISRDANLLGSYSMQQSCLCKASIIKD